MPTFDPRHAAVLVIDPYNDVLAHGGLSRPEWANQALTPPELVEVVRRARAASLLVVYVPHRTWVEGALDHWRRPTPEQLHWDRLGLFEKDGWGGRWFPGLEPERDDVIAHGHHHSNGFADTDLDLQLRQRAIEKLFFASGGHAHCTVDTASFAMSRGFHVTALVRDEQAPSQPGAGPEPLRFAHVTMSVVSFADLLVTRSGPGIAGPQRAP